MADDNQWNDDPWPEVKDEELTTPKLVVPKFQDEIPARELQSINSRDVPMVIAVYKMAKQIDFLVEVAVNANRTHREQERSNLSLRKEVLKMRRWRRALVQKWGKVVALVVIVTTALTSGLVNSLFQVIAEKLFGMKP